ncbi:unnamed protein product [Pleuronectes platessa]|uniref:Uncharacterized protein n=1 Tax=Pleuronectes platessa TaxID=8262 RepID=A0A9N7VFY1_PLEPL|nr:unnamed protein product [Pleuronectes platessa]
MARACCLTISEEWSNGTRRFQEQQGLQCPLFVKDVHSTWPYGMFHGVVGDMASMDERTGDAGWPGELWSREAASDMVINGRINTSISEVALSISRLFLLLPPRSLLLPWTDHFITGRISGSGRQGLLAKDIDGGSEDTNTGVRVKEEAAEEAVRKLVEDGGRQLQHKLRSITYIKLRLKAGSLLLMSGNSKYLHIKD